MKSVFKALEDLTWFLQLGISLLMPLLLMMALCWWLTQRFSVGSWVFIPGLILGLGASAVSFRSFSRIIMNRPENKVEKEKPVRFNRHS